MKSYDERIDDLSADVALLIRALEQMTSELTELKNAQEAMAQRVKAICKDDNDEGAAEYEEYLHWRETEGAA